MGQESAHLDLTILSASDLKRGWLSGDQTVAVAWVDPSLKKSTEVRSGGGSNAQWDEKLKLPLSDADVVARHGKRLTIEIRSQGALAGDNLLASVNVPLVELAFDTQKEANSTQTYQLVLPSGKRYGSVSFVGKIVKSGSSQSLPSAPPASLLHAYQAGLQSNTLYPPISQSSFGTYNEKPFVHSAYPPVYVSANCSSGYGMASHPPELYGPVNAPYPPELYGHVNAPYPPHLSTPPCAPCSNVDSMSPYPLYFSSAPYPPPTSVYENPLSMYQNPSPSAPYPPKLPCPPTAPHYLGTQNPPPSWDAYPAHSTPLYPPLYPPQHHAPPNWCGPHPAF